MDGIAAYKYLCCVSKPNLSSFSVLSLPIRLFFVTFDPVSWWQIILRYKQPILVDYFINTLTNTALKILEAGKTTKTHFVCSKSKANERTNERLFMSDDKEARVKATAIDKQP